MGVPPAGHAFWAKVGGSITFVTSGVECWAAQKTAKYLHETGGSFIGGKPYMLAFEGQPSLHGYDSCVVYWGKGALWRICRQEQSKTSFSPSRVLLFS